MSQDRLDHSEPIEGPVKVKSPLPVNHIGRTQYRLGELAH